MTFSELVATPLSFLVMPDKRLFFGYLATSLGLAIVVMAWQKRLSPWGILSAIFDRRVWLHPSAQLDYHLFMVNIFLRIIFIAVTALSSWGVALVTLRWLHSHFAFPGLGLSYYPALLLFTVVSFVGLDFSRFLQHYLMHKIPFLWQFHKIHHSAQVLTPMTLYRTHPVESLISMVNRSLVLGLIAAGFIFLTQSPVGGFEVIGVNIFDFVFNLLGSNLRHSHIWLSFGPLNYLVISPSQHQIHHSRSRQHSDKNFGIALSLWDVLFGTFHNAASKQFLIFGLRDEKHQTLKEALISPFKSARH